MESKQSTSQAKTRNVFHLRFITKKDLAKDLDFESTSELEKAMKAVGKDELLKKQGWYYSPKEMGNILFALGKIKQLPVFSFKTALSVI
jgi:threonyl-tRNA synthetase